MPEVSVKITADAEQMAAGAKQAAGDINKINRVEDALKRRREAMERLNRRLRDQARQRRKEAFDSLSVEDRILKLKERQARAAERLTKATTDYRRAALQVRHNELGQQIKSLETGGGGSGGSGGAGGILGYLLGRFGGRWGGAAKGLAGRLGPGALMAGGAALPAGLLGAAAMRGAGDSEQTQRQAMRLGISSSEARALEYAGSMTGLEMGQIISLIEQLKKAQGEVLMGNENMARSFAELGISIDGVRTRSHVELFRELVTTLGNGSASAKEFAAAQKVLGEASREAMVAFRTGFAEFQQAGGLFGMSDSDIAAGSALSRKWRSLKGWLGGTARNVRGQLGGAANALLNRGGMYLGGAFYGTDWGRSLHERSAMELANYQLGLDPVGQADSVRRLEELLMAKRGLAAGEPGALEANTDAMEALTAEYRRQLDLQAADSYARMGMFLTPGSSAYTNNLIGLQQRSLSELQQIKAQITRQTTTIEKVL